MKIVLSGTFLQPDICLRQIYTIRASCWSGHNNRYCCNNHFFYRRQVTCDGHVVVHFALGAGYATIMPASFTWINREMALTGRFSAAYWSGFFLGLMSLPSLTGWLFEAVVPMWLPYMTLLAGFGMAALFVVINVVIMREHRRTKARAAVV